MSAEKTLSRRVVVNVVRDLTATTPIIVWQHEIPVLESIHGEGNIVDVTAKVAEDMDKGYRADKKDPYRYKPSECLGIGDVFDGDVTDEWQRMQAIYGIDPEKKTPRVEMVYGPLQLGRFASLVGSPEVKDLSNRQLRKHLVEKLELFPDEFHKDQFDRLTVVQRDWRPDAKRDELLKLATAKKLKEAA